MADTTDYLNQTLGDRLISVRRAIDKTESAQSYKIDNREKENPRLTALYAREKTLLKKIDDHGRDYIEGAVKKKKRNSFSMVGSNVIY